MPSLSRRLEALEVGGNRLECVVCQIGRELTGHEVAACAHRFGYSYVDAIRDLDQQTQEDADAHYA